MASYNAFLIFPINPIIRLFFAERTHFSLLFIELHVNRGGRRDILAISHRLYAL